MSDPKPKTYAQIHEEAFGPQSEIEARRKDLERRVLRVDWEEIIGNLLFYGLLGVLVWMAMRFV